MRAASICPAKGKCLLLDRAFLHEELVLVIEKEDAESPMREGVRFRKVLIGMSCPFIEGLQILIFMIDKDEFVKQYFVWDGLSR